MALTDVTLADTRSPRATADQEFCTDATRPNDQLPRTVGIRGATPGSAPNRENSDQRQFRGIGEARVLKPAAGRATSISRVPFDTDGPTSKNGWHRRQSMKADRPSGSAARLQTDEAF